MGISLKPIHISQVKEEFRILGIVARQESNGLLIIGSVYRGDQTLDGVLSIKEDADPSNLVIKMLKNSKHYGQVRLILFDKESLPARFNFNSIWEETGKPVLVLSDKGFFDPRFMFIYKNKTIQAYGIDESSAMRVLYKIFDENYPETLRVASIILKAIPEFA